jgi:hypothetical protein
MIHAALIQVKHRRVSQIFQFAPEEPALDLVAFRICCEFF